MFDLDKWQEIFGTLKRNKLRATLTACGVIWGVFMLIVMLGFGNGLELGVTRNMTGFATNSLYVWGQRTSVPYKGLSPGRNVRFRNGDIDALKRGVPEIEYMSPRNQLGGYRSGNTVTRGLKSGSFQVNGDYPEFSHIQPMIFQKGRFINPLDMKHRRKVAVVGEQVVKELWEKDEDPIGTHLKINDVHFTVVGVFKSRRKGDDGDRDSSSIFIPFTTFQATFNYGDSVGWFAITVPAHVDSNEVEQKVKSILRTRHKVSPDDPQGLGSFNVDKEFRKVWGLFGGIRFMMWFVGSLTLVAGVIGICNIMLIVVKERTKEIGIRKAMGATPSSIIGQLIQESTTLTLLAGYVGLIIALGVLELAGLALGSDAGREVFANPYVDVQIALVATGVLVVSGALAGVLPARMAVRINPMEALRME